MLAANVLTVGALILCINGLSLEKSLPSRELIKLDTSTLQYVYAFFRHGIRSPLNKPYPTDPNKSKYKHFFPGPTGALTKMGKEEMYEVGKRLLNIYGSFVGDFSEEKVRASSTETDRTIMSAQSVMAGLFPPKKPLFLDLVNWQPIPIWLDSEEFDKVYFYNDPQFPRIALKECPRYGEMVQKGYNLVLGKDQEKDHQKIYQLLQQKTGDLAVDTIDEAYRIYDTLEMEELNGLKLPDWATKIRPELGGALYPDLMRPLQVKWFMDCQWLNKDPEMLLFYSGPLFHNINSKLQEKIGEKGKDNKKNKEVFRYHNTHDDTILTLRWALGFDDDKVEVEAGDGIAFELHKVNGNHYVKVVYYHSLRKSDDFREELELPACPTPCSYEKFSKEYPSLSPQEWEDKCHVPSVLKS